MLHGSHRSHTGTYLLFLDSYDNGVPVGTLYCPVQGKLGSFCSLIQLLSHIERMLDADATSHFRESVSPPPRETPSATIPLRGSLASFSLHVLFRMNSSWQGTVTWLEGEQTQHFRSVMELIHLINNAMERKQMRPGTDQPQSLYWAE